MSVFQIFEGFLCIFKQVPLIVFECQLLVSPFSYDSFGDLGLATHRVNSNDAAQNL